MFRTFVRTTVMSLWCLALAGTAPSIASAEPLRVQPVTENAYAIVGPLGNRSPENLGNNATFGFVVTSAGVVLIDAGGSYRGAAAIHRLIRQTTDQPVRIVINTGGQDHRWLGNGYFKQRGARIIASREAVADQRQRAPGQLFALGNLVGESGMAGTEPVYADELFDEAMTLTLGNTTFELRHPGPAHTPGDSFVWLPEQRLLFSGDIVYVKRLLGVMAYSQSRSWLEAFEAVAALAPETLVPGHGPPASLAKATADSYDYLRFLRKLVGDFMAAGGGIEAVGTLDQSRFAHLENYETLKGRNAQRIYEELEWE